MATNNYTINVNVSEKTVKAIKNEIIDEIIHGLEQMKHDNSHDTAE